MLFRQVLKRIVFAFLVHLLQCCENGVFCWRQRASAPLPNWESCGRLSFSWTFWGEGSCRSMPVRLLRRQWKSPALTLPKIFGIFCALVFLLSFLRERSFPQDSSPMERTSFWGDVGHAAQVKADAAGAFIAGLLDTSYGGAGERWKPFYRFAERGPGLFHESLVKVRRKPVFRFQGQGMHSS